MNTSTTTPAESKRDRLPGVLAWATAILLLFVAWKVVASTPTFDDEVAPFESSARADQWVSGRNINARVLGATFADSVDDGLWHSDGNWLVVDVDAAAVGEPASLDSVSLVIGETTFGPTDRTLSTFYRQPLVAGIARTGPLAFELPPGQLSGQALLKLGVAADPQLDSLLVFQIEVADLERVPTVVLAAPTWSER